MKRNRLIFRVGFILFILFALGMLWHMASNTMAPWEKNKIEKNQNSTEENTAK